MNPKAEDTLRCRAQRGMWLFPTVLLLMAIIVFVDNFIIQKSWEPRVRPVMAALSAGLMLAAVVMAIWLLVFEVRADDQGLRWRTPTGWRFEPWASVTDYYIAPTRGGVRRIAVVFGDHKLEFDARMINLSALQDYVRPQSIIPGGQPWGTLGARNTDPWPREFRYRRQHVLALCSLAVTVSLALPFIAYICLDIWRLTTEPAYGAVMPQIIRLELLVALGIELVLLALLWNMAFLLCPTVRYLLRHSRTIVTATPDALLLRNKDGEIRIPWSEIDQFEHFSKGPLGRLGGYVVRSPSDKIEFSSVIGNLSVLKATILANTSGLSLE